MCSASTSTGCGPPCSTTSRNSAISFFRPSHLVRRRRDGTFDVQLHEDARAVLVGLFREVADAIEAAPDDDDLARLRPPAYSDDPDRDLEYQLLAGEELRTSHRASFATAIEAMGQARLSEDEMWAWLRALNAIRLVVGTRLDIADDDATGPPAIEDLPPATARLWTIYQYTTVIHYEVVRALQG